MENNDTQEINSLQQALSMLNKQHAIIKIGSKVRILDEFDSADIKFLTANDFVLFYKNLVAIKQETKETTNGETTKKTAVEVAKIWLSSDARRQYQRVVFDPSGKHGTTDYNLWKGFAVEPKQGDCSLYWDHVFNVICDRDVDRFTYLRKWMAHAVQKPEQLPLTAIVTKGPHGSGKGVCIQPFGKLFGPHFGHYDSIEKVLGKFNLQLENKIVVFADEATWGGYRQMDGALKNLITGETKQIERKRLDSYTVNNFTRLIVASNSEFPIRSEAGERRFAFYPVSGGKVRDFDYFDKIVKQMDSKIGLQALMYDLMTEDISNFDPKDIPESARTNDLADSVTSQSMSSEQSFVYDLLHDTSWIPSGGRIVVKTFYERYVQWFQDNHRTGSISDKQAFGRLIWNKMIPVERALKINTTVIKVIPDLATCRRFFEENVLKRKEQWDDNTVIVEGNDPINRLINELSFE